MVPYYVISHLYVVTSHLSDVMVPYNVISHLYVVTSHLSDVMVPYYVISHLYVVMTHLSDVMVPYNVISHLCDVMTHLCDVMVPYNAAFRSKTMADIPLLVVDSVVDVVFFIDIVLNFHTSFVVTQHLPINRSFHSTRPSLDQAARSSPTRRSYAPTTSRAG